MIYLIRHTECKANVNKVWCGITESPVTERGNIQLDYLTKEFTTKNIDTIISSPIGRAFKTAQAIQKSQSNTGKETHITLDDRLVEFNGGHWEGKSSNELYKLEDYNKFCTDIEHSKAEHGDSMQDFKNRMITVASDLYNSDKDITIISHGVTLKVLLSVMFNTKIDEQPWLNNCEYVKVDSRFIKCSEPISDFIPSQYNGYKW